MLSEAGQGVYDKLNLALRRVQEWLLSNYPNYANAFSDIIQQEEKKNSDAYYGILGVLIRMEHEGEEIFKETLRQEYILTDAVREIVIRLQNKELSADERIDAWVELKQLLNLK